MNTELPSAYLTYLEEDGTDAASTEGEPGYFQLWHPDELDEINRGFRVGECVPGLLGFGSDGGGEMLAFAIHGAVFMIPFIGMVPKVAKKIASSWSEIVARITK